MFISDLSHFLDLPDDAPGPARRMAEHLTLIVRAATAGDAGLRWTSALPCRRRPGRRACPGHLGVFRMDVPPSIEWWCAMCGDEGVISGWERSPFDLRSRQSGDGSPDTFRVVIPSEEAGTLRGLTLIDTARERLVFRAVATEQGLVLTGDEDDFEELIGYVAAEANHEDDRRRRKRLDAAFATLEEAILRESAP